jgi:hypothetical protein
VERIGRTIAVVAISSTNACGSNVSSGEYLTRTRWEPVPAGAPVEAQVPFRAHQQTERNFEIGQGGGDAPHEGETDSGLLVLPGEPPRDPTIATN